MLGVHKEIPGLAKMVNLGKAAIDAWLSSLPDDVKSLAADDPQPLPSEDLLRKVANAKPSEIVEILVADPEAAQALGRARRLRLVAWLLGTALPKEAWGDVIDALTGEGEDDGGGKLPSCPAHLLFLGDLRAFNDNIIAARTAARIAAPSALAIAAEASVVHEAELTLTQGGVR